MYKTCLEEVHKLPKDMSAPKPQNPLLLLKRSEQEKWQRKKQGGDR
jgi:hypothetical protein